MTKYPSAKRVFAETRENRHRPDRLLLTSPCKTAEQRSESLPPNEQLKILLSNSLIGYAKKSSEDSAIAGNEREKILNAPYAFTMFRMLLLPVYWYFILKDHYYTAFAVFIIASLTDLANGCVARKYNLVTNFGKLMDPLANKRMTTSVMLSFVFKGG